MKIGDIICILMALIITIVTLFFTTNNTEEKSKIVTLKVNNVLVKEILMDDKLNIKYNFEFGDNLGSFIIRNSKVRMNKMDKEICKNQICSKTGWIEEINDLIVCLPNKIILSIHGPESNTIIDINSY